MCSRSFRAARRRQPLQDRIETVRFPNPGKFLVICGVLPHFFDAATGQFIMFGYVRVHP